MSTLDWKSQDRQITVTCIKELALTDQTFQKLMQQLRDWERFLDVVRVEVAYDPDTESYEYSFKARDGRRWKQHIKIPGDTTAPVTMKFNVQDWFSQDEFIPGREIRSQLIALMKTQGMAALLYKRA